MHASLLGMKEVDQLPSSVSAMKVREGSSRDDGIDMIADRAMEAQASRWFHFGKQRQSSDSAHDKRRWYEVTFGSSSQLGMHC